MARSFSVEITETIVYSKTFDLESVAQMLDMTTTELESMSDAQIADLMDGDEKVEEALQGEGDVQGSSWVILPE